MTPSEIQRTRGDLDLVDDGTSSIIRRAGLPWETTSYSRDRILVTVKILKIPTVRLKSVGRCMYGQEISGLTDEHIVPFGLNGPWVLPEASCKTHRDITSRLERHVQRGPWLAARTVLGFPTRHPNERPERFTLYAERTGGEERIEVPPDEHLAPLVFPVFRLPAYLDGRTAIEPVDSWIDERRFLIGQRGTQHLSHLSEKYGAKTFSSKTEIRLSIFARFLGKAAYGFAVAQYGLDRIAEAYVLPAVLGEAGDIFRWVGTAENAVLAGPNVLHRADFAFTAKGDIIVRLALLSLFGAPEYLVVVGRLKDHLA